MIGIVMFFVALLMLIFGFPVAFTFGGVALIFGVIAEGPDMFAFMPFRIQSIMENVTLMDFVIWYHTIFPFFIVGAPRPGRRPARRADED